MNTPTNDAFASNTSVALTEVDASMEVSLDDCWIGALSRLGRVVMALHRLSANTGIDQFQAKAFAALRAELDFDAGFWATGKLHPAPVLHDAYCHCLPHEAFVAWQAQSGQDPLLVETIARRGNTLRTQLVWPDPADPTPAKAEVLATSLVDPALGAIDSFRIFRRNGAAHFDDPERLLVQHALPHMVEAWRNLRQRQLRLDKLTAREVDVARRFGQGLSYQEIARELHIAPATVRNHLANIYGKVGVSNKIELARLFA